MSNCEAVISIGIQGQVLCWIVSIPDLCPLSYLEHTGKCIRRFGHAHGDLCKHLRIDSSTGLDNWYSNLFLNAYINRHSHTEYLKMI